MRDDDNFDLFWQRVLLLGKECGINDPMLPRPRKRPRRYSNDISDEDIPTKVEDIYQPIYFEAIDLVINGIKMRFDQTGYRIYINKEDYEEELVFICDSTKDS